MTKLSRIACIASSLVLAACASLAQAPADFDDGNCSVRTFVDDFTDMLAASMLGCFFVDEEEDSLGGFRFDHFYDGSSAEAGVLQFTVFDLDHRGEAGEEVYLQIRVGKGDAIDVEAFWEDGAKNGASALLSLAQVDELLEELQEAGEVIYRIDRGTTRRVEFSGESLGLAAYEFFRRVAEHEEERQRSSS